MADANLEEALDYSTYDPDDVIVVDGDLRTMKPNKGILFGVYNDMNVHALSFEIPRYYDEIDLSSFQIRVNIQNANGLISAEEVTDVKPYSDKITFNWPLNRVLFEKEGTVKFNVCLKRFNPAGELLREFNSTIGTGIVLEGLEVDDVSKQSILYRLRELRDKATVVEGININAVNFSRTQLETLVEYLGA